MKRDKKIQKVKEFFLGQLIVYAGKKYRITSFPFRTSAVIESIYQISGYPSIKTTISDLRENAQIGGQHDEVEVGDRVKFRYFNPNHDMKSYSLHEETGLIVERITREFDMGKLKWMATVGGTKYDLEYCTIEKKWNA